MATVLRDRAEYPLARLPLLLLVLPLYFLLPKQRVLTGLLSLAAFHFLIWSQGAHVIRYLTSAQPEMCLGPATCWRTLHGSLASERLARIWRLACLWWGWRSGRRARVSVMFGRPFLQTVGLESREAYLLRGSPNHSLVTRLNRQGADVRGVLLIGDRRGFYVDAPTWVDVSLGAFETLAKAPDADTARTYLDGLGVSHVLVSVPESEWHAGYDDQGRIRAWFHGSSRRSPEDLVEEARYYDLTLYRVVDHAAAGSSPDTESPLACGQTEGGSRPG